MRRNVWLAMIVLCVLGLVAQAEVIRDTAYVQGADTYVSNDSQQAPTANMGTEIRMRAWRQLAATRSKAAFIRFDISEVTGSMADATLTLAYTYMKGGASTVSVYGLNDGPDDFWIESGTGGITYNTAPGLLPTTLGNYLLDSTKATLLGTLSSPGVMTLPYSMTTDPATLNLQAFLEADTNGVVTFFFIGGNDEDELATKEHTDQVGYHCPILTMPHGSLGGAYDPVPAEDAVVNRNMLTQLSWSLIPEAAKLDIYFGTSVTDANLLSKLSFDPAVTSVNIDAFPNGQTPLADGTYYWKIDCWDGASVDPNFFEGSFWSFTATSAPVFSSITPALQAKVAGESAAITAEFESSVTLSYQWYRSVDHVNSTSADDVAVGTNSNVLSLSDLTNADDGSYYCVATGGGQTISDVARVTIKRQLAHWEFEGNALDTLGNYNGTLVAEPNIAFPAGQIGQAIQLSGAYADLPDGFVDFTAGLTVTFWANPSAAASWARFIDMGNGAGVQNLFVTRDGTTANLILNTGAGTASAANALTLNEWQFFAVTMTDAGAVTIYKNGLQAGTGTVGLPALALRTLNFIGESNYTSDALYTGMIDDMQLWNYAVDADTLANLYAAGYGSPYCRYKPALDWSNNCVVDLADFQTFATDWLECGLWPVSGCDAL